jgi:hypothetical protein
LSLPLLSCLLAELAESALSLDPETLHISPRSCSAHVCPTCSSQNEASRVEARSCCSLAKALPRHPPQVSSHPSRPTCWGAREPSVPSPPFSIHPGPAASSLLLPLIGLVPRAPRACCRLRSLPSFCVTFL